MKAALLLLLLLASCQVTYEVEPRTEVPCKHVISRDGSWITVRVKSENDYVDICLSSAVYNINCSRHTAAYFDCIRFNAGIDTVLVEVYDGVDYCAEKI